MSKIGWIIYNGNLPGNKFLDFAEMLQEAAEKHHSTAYIIKNNDVLVTLGSERLDLLTEYERPDYVIFTDKDIYLARQLEQLGIPVFNSSQVIETSDDKIATYQVLAKHKLPIPKTIVAPKVFYNREEKYLPNLEMIISHLGLPLIVKEAFGSFGEQVHLVHSKEELKNKIVELYGKPFMFQEFIATSKGMDIRIQVVGDQVVAAMKRIATNDFRANITTGGVMERYEPSEKAKEIALAASKSIGADFCGIDLLFGEDDTYYVCEINSNAHIRNLLDCTGINAADAMVEYILNKLGG
ncbi:ATP-grasp domain-containing protein [Ornithinibacillus californiensis]|uniref:ATP-grasp domain-containing protein n=1 Tax=Ornithinibacillus californiensis TaxID=161536 RepID=UPI00064DF4A2|nr:RimK family alpha-L-glutamate ligase [Ornithinibacillus californiensis]